MNISKLLASGLNFTFGYRGLPYVHRINLVDCALSACQVAVGKLPASQVGPDVHPEVAGATLKDRAEVLVIDTLDDRYINAPSMLILLAMGPTTFAFSFFANQMHCHSPSLLSLNFRLLCLDI